MTATKSKQSTSTAPKNTNNFGNVRIAAPIYVGVTSELSKEILESLRRKCGSDATSTVMPHTSISVVDSGTTQAQHDLERRLRIDLKTLRMVLFDSWNRGLNLDLALHYGCKQKSKMMCSSLIDKLFKKLLANRLITTLISQPMPKRHNVTKSNGGADLDQLNDLHDQLVFAAHQALKNEIANGEIKASTLNSIRQICADAGIQPSRETGSELQELSMLLPTLDVQAIPQFYRG